MKTASDDLITAADAPGGDHAGRGGAAIAAAGIRKDYGDRAVLRGVDLSIDWGEIVVLFGANGAGKTTLLRILAGLVRPDQGTAHVAGRSLHRRGGRARRLVGFAGHQTMLYSDLTCRENLAFYGRLYGLDRAGERIDRALAQANLLDRADRRVRTLSHGMQKRLAMTRATLHDPVALLLDEPESGLDAASVAALGGMLRAWAASGRSALLTTHVAAVGLAWADRALTLAGGRITAGAPPAETADATGAAAALNPGC